MAIYREPPKNKLYSVDLESLMQVCKSDAEREALYNAIAEMEMQGESKLTFDTKVRAQTYQNALIQAGLSQETIDSFMEQGDLSGLVTDRGTKLAEAYLNENLREGYYVNKAEVEKVIKQFNDDTMGVMSQKMVKARFEAAMSTVCDNAKKFDANELADMQIAAGKNGKDYEIYRKDKSDGLCITDVPKAVIAANKEEIVANLKEQVNKQIQAEHKHANNIGSGAKQFVNGDAENMSKGTLMMTAAAAMFIFSKIMESEKRKALEDALKQGTVAINDTLKKLSVLEKNSMTEGIENDKDGVDVTDTSGIMDELDGMGLFEG